MSAYRSRRCASAPTRCSASSSATAADALAKLRVRADPKRAEAAHLRARHVEGGSRVKEVLPGRDVPVVEQIPAHRSHRIRAARSLARITGAAGAARWATAFRDAPHGRLG